MLIAARYAINKRSSSYVLPSFTIQNICPISDKYIKNEYFDKNDGVPVRVAANFEEELIKKAKLVILLERKGVKLVFPDIMEIERRLLAERK